MKTEILEIDREETELTIQELNAFCEDLNALTDSTKNPIVKEVYLNALKDIEKEIEYQEFHIQELNASILFEDSYTDIRGLN